MLQTRGVAVAATNTFFTENMVDLLHVVALLQILSPTSLEQELDRHGPFLVNDRTFVCTIVYLRPQCLGRVKFVWTLAGEHLPKQHGERVRIASRAVRLAVGNLWSHVTRRTGHLRKVVSTVRIHEIMGELLGQSKIKDLHVIADIDCEASRLGYIVDGCVR